MDESANQDNFEFGLQPLWEKLQLWYEGGIKMLPNFLLAFLVLLVGIYVTRALKRTFKLIANRWVRSQAVANLFSSAMTVVLVLVLIFMILGILGLSTAVQSLLAGAGVVGLALGLAFQDPILNLFSGIIISTRDFFRVGDLVEANGFFGKISRISLRSTIIETLSGQEVIIPNKMVAQSPLKNYSITGRRRVELSCGVSYGDKLDMVQEVTINAIKTSVNYDESRPVELFFNAFGDSSINYTLRFWLGEHQTAQPDFLAAQSDAIMAIKRAYDLNDIAIPFPIRTLDFGIKGGETLSSSLQKIEGGLLKKNQEKPQLSKGKAGH